MKVSILHKHVTLARHAIRQRIANRSVFVRRLHGRYYIYAHIVTDKQQKQRDIFAQAQSLAKAEMASRTRRRFWSREALNNKVAGPRRMAVSFFCRMLRKYRGQVDRILLILDSLCPNPTSHHPYTHLSSGIYALKNCSNTLADINFNVRIRQKNTTQLCYSNEKSINLQRAVKCTQFSKTSVLLGK